MRFLSALVAVSLAACSGEISAPGTDAGGVTGDSGRVIDAGGTVIDAGPTLGEDPSVAGIVAAHNAARAAVSPAPTSGPMPALVWSPSAYTTARTWAAGCQFAHNAGRGNLGENIFATSGSTTAQAVVTSWVSEKTSYNYAANSCSGTCGHYTQVVWAATTAIGCAAQNCTTGSPLGGGNWQFWVCDYSPPGNFGGQRPY